MIKGMKPRVLLMIGIGALAPAQNTEQASKPRPAPEIQRVAKMLVGTWKVVEDFAPGGSMPKEVKKLAAVSLERGQAAFL
jgi:hypothetical protein